MKKTKATIVRTVRVRGDHSRHLPNVVYGLVTAAVLALMTTVSIPSASAETFDQYPGQMCVKTGAKGELVYVSGLVRNLGSEPLHVQCPILAGTGDVTAAVVTMAALNSGSQGACTLFSTRRGIFDGKQYYKKSAMVLFTGSDSPKDPITPAVYSYPLGHVELVDNTSGKFSPPTWYIDCVIPPVDASTGAVSYISHYAISRQ